MVTPKDPKLVELLVYLREHQEEDRNFFDELIERTINNDDYCVFSNIRQFNNHLDYLDREASESQWFSLLERIRRLRKEIRRICADTPDVKDKDGELKNLLLDLKGLDFPEVNLLKSFQTLNRIVELESERSY